MSRSFAAPVRRSSLVPAASSLLIVGGGSLFALMLGALAARDPLLAAFAGLAAAVAMLIGFSARAVPAILILTLFVEGVALTPGLRVGRIGGVLAISIVLYYLLSQGRGVLRFNALMLAALAYGAWILASAYWADNVGFVSETFFRYLLAIAYMLAFAVLVRSARDVSLVLAALAFAALVSGVFAFVQYLGSGDAFAELGRGAKGLQGDHNFFALYQVIALPAALVVAATVKSRLLAALSYAAVGAIVLSVPATLSRSGLLALLAVVLATLLIPARFFFRTVQQKFAYLCLLLSGIMLVVLLQGDPFLRRASTILSEQGDTGARGSGRIDIWRTAWHGFSEQPIVGLGAGNYRARSLELFQTTPGIDTRATVEQSTGDYVHSIFIGNLTELGIIGLMLFVAVLFFTVRYLLLTFVRARASKNLHLERISVALLISLVGYIVSGAFLSIELSKPLWIVAGLALALDAMTRPATVAGSAGGFSRPLQPRPRAVDGNPARAAVEAPAISAGRPWLQRDARIP